MASAYMKLAQIAANDYQTYTERINNSAEPGLDIFVTVFGPAFIQVGFEEKGTFMPCYTRAVCQTVYPETAHCSFPEFVSNGDQFTAVRVYNCDSAPRDVYLDLTVHQA